MNGLCAAGVLAGAGVPNAPAEGPEDPKPPNDGVEAGAGPEDPKPPEDPNGASGLLSEGLLLPKAKAGALLLRLLPPKVLGVGGAA